MPYGTMLARRITKACGAVLSPWKWGLLLNQASDYLKNILLYGNFSFNLNSRGYWDAHLARLGDFWRNENYAHLVELLPRDDPFSLLDVGCALGDGCELLKEAFPRASIAGADISQVGIEKARAKPGGVTYFVLDVLVDPLPARYDYITIVETLEHFDDPMAVVDKCLRHVDRSLIVSVPYTPTRSGRVIVVGEHRYCFNEETFAGYDHRIVGIREHGKTDKEIVIIYEIRPPSKH